MTQQAKVDMHEWNDRYAAGERGEGVLDSLFATWYLITPATRDEQRRGIDRWFTNRVTEVRKAVEYKTDERAGQTGNAFVETISVDTAHKQGWAYTSQAEYLIYRVTEPEAIYVLRLDALRAVLPRWERKYPRREVQNHGYKTVGLLVPLHEFEVIAEKVL